MATQTINLTAAQLDQMLQRAAQTGAQAALSKNQHHHHTKVVEEWDDEVPAVKKGKKTTTKKTKKGKKKAEKVCWAETRTKGKYCSKTADHDDGLCGQHHAMVERCEALGPKTKNPKCMGTTKKGNACKNYAMDGENFCYNHLNE